jgi:hypothetical protein
MATQARSIASLTISFGLVAYRDALAQDPAMADAHYNLARLHERAGDAQACFRHLLAYRRLASCHPQ